MATRTTIGTTSDDASTFPPLAITMARMEGKVGAALAYTPVVTGGFGVQSFDYLGDTPSGLTFDKTTGGFSGTPLQASDERGYLRVRDDSGTARIPVRFAIAARVTAIGLTTPPAGQKFALSLNRALRVGSKLALVKAA